MIFNRLSRRMRRQNWDFFLPAGRAGSFISITIRTCTHTKVRLHFIIYLNPNPNPNQKNLKVGVRKPNPVLYTLHRPKRLLLLGLQKWLRFLNMNMYLSQCSEPALPADTIVYQRKEVPLKMYQ